MINWDSKEGSKQRMSNVQGQRTVRWGTVVSWRVRLWPMAEWVEWMMKSEGDSDEELNNEERMWEWVCELLCLRPVSVDNRTKQTVDMAMSPEYW